MIFLVIIQLYGAPPVQQGSCISNLNRFMALSDPSPAIHVYGDELGAHSFSSVYGLRGRQ